MPDENQPARVIYDDGTRITITPIAGAATINITLPHSDTFSFIASQQELFSLAGALSRIARNLRPTPPHIV